MSHDVFFWVNDNSVTILKNRDLGESIYSFDITTFDITVSASLENDSIARCQQDPYFLKNRPYHRVQV